MLLLVLAILSGVATVIMFWFILRANYARSSPGPTEGAGLIIVSLVVTIGLFVWWGSL